MLILSSVTNVTFVFPHCGVFLFITISQIAESSNKFYQVRFPDSEIFCFCFAKNCHSNGEKVRSLSPRSQTESLYSLYEE
ncbi:hypothetical protein K450DRAFT_226938 [Umbelopsis ramanniana AG]|uniref:Uncharacterized protein n=1 Tax=Umbelopsis ramanniana AG TaxID=1314678 RepID=A0AAD5HHK7_UMBRA|nr:uncharacterized protein K450DRAFT_226938 [Umbelopsis ramanniana AG]KAI8582796.1 hypothetical protein K450DRAFT_226938 [Umbelopsis ramanniana AG]